MATFQKQQLFAMQVMIWNQHDKLKDTYIKQKALHWSHKSQPFTVQSWANIPIYIYLLKVKPTIKIIATPALDAYNSLL